MPRFHRHMTVAVIAMTTLPAYADLTAEDVWADVQAYSSSFGYEVTGETSRSDGDFVVTNMTMTAAQLSDTNAGSMTLERVVFREQADGSVSIAVPTVMPIEMVTEAEAGETATITMDYLQSGLDIVASGDPQNILYTYSADSLTLKTNQILIEGLSGDEALPEISFSVNDMAGTTEMSIDSQRRYDQSVQAASMSYVMSIADGEESADVKGAVNAVSFSGVTALPLRAVSAADMDAMLAAGFTVDGTFSFADSSFEVSGTSPDGTFSGTGTGQDGSVSVTMDATKLSYDVAQSGLDVNVTSADFPVPLTFGVANSEFAISLPVRQSDDPQDFAFDFTLDGFSMSELLWGMFDPAGQLPRDPAVVAIGLAGKAKLLFDFLNPDIEAMQSQGFDQPPVELEEVEINKLQLSVAGADLTGKGAFEFETTPVGIPQPVGSVDLTLVGGNALIDKLVAIGLVPEQQAMGARMMLGLLAVPGNAPDTLNSKIEINEQGHISANGQRIQ